ncbi:MAG: class I adenylate-forming enzyme family protein [Acidimicrobiales bacterium]
MSIRSWRDHLASGSPLDVPDLLEPRTLPVAWARAWRADPRAPLLHEVSAGPDGGRWVSAGELDDRSARAAGILSSYGLEPGDRLVWSSGPTVAGIVAHLGALRLGIAVVPANLAYTARELGHVFVDVAPRGAVVTEPWQAELASSLGIEAVLTTSLEPALSRVPGRRNRAKVTLDAVGPDAAALIGYTSGTTGAPKGAVLSHGNVLANSRALAWAWRIGAEDRLVHALPIFHGHGLCASLYTMLMSGGGCVLLPSFDVPSVLDAAAAHSATLFFGVPTMYHRLAASDRTQELSALRLCVSGSAPLAPALHDAMKEAGVDVLERYGMTETLLTVSNPYDGDRRAGTVGFPLPGVEAQVRPVEERDGDDPKGVGAGGGMLWVRGPHVFSGYFGRPAATEGLFDGDWFRTGDLAAVEGGYIRILGRAGDLIISGGYNVYPAEVEDVLLRHGAVAEVAVTGTPSTEWGEIVTAWIVPAEGGIHLDELQAFVGPLLAPYKRPRLLHVVDALPRNAMGKVKRSELR